MKSLCRTKWPVAIVRPHKKTNARHLAVPRGKLLFNFFARFPLCETLRTTYFDGIMEIARQIKPFEQAFGQVLMPESDTLDANSAS